MCAHHLVTRIWSFCHTLRDDGIGYGDYLEQHTYLLDLKMADELGRPPYSRTLPVPKEYAWDTLTYLRRAELKSHYTTLLRELGKFVGSLGQIFTTSQNEI